MSTTTPVPVTSTTTPVPVTSTTRSRSTSAVTGLHDELTLQQLEQANDLHELSKAAITGEHARVDLGRRLLQIRPTWPKSGRKAGGWKLFLEAADIEKRTAQRYMRAAMNADKIRDTVSQKPKPTVLERVRRLIRRLSVDERALLRHDLQLLRSAA